MASVGQVAQCIYLSLFILECLSTEFGLWAPIGLSQREVIRRWSEPGDHEAQSIDMGLGLTIIAHLIVICRALGVVLSHIMLVLVVVVLLGRK